MNRSASAPEQIDALLRHREFVAALARRLVRDPAGAADVEQDTWLTALERPPERESGLRGWLGAVVRNVSRQRKRADRRRTHWETRKPTRSAVPSPEEILEREVTRRRLVAAVGALDEPYRSTVLLRYFEGLSPSQIAEHQNVPVETVKTRLKRAHARLRNDLEEHDPAWRAALLPLAAWQSPAARSAPEPVKGARPMSPLIKAAVVTSLLVSVVSVVHFLGETAPTVPGGGDGQTLRAESGHRPAVMAPSAVSSVHLPPLSTGSAALEEAGRPPSAQPAGDEDRLSISGRVTGLRESKSRMDLGVAIWKEDDEKQNPMGFGCDRSGQVRFGDFVCETNHGEFVMRGLEAGRYHLIGYEVWSTEARDELVFRHAWSEPRVVEAGTRDLELVIEQNGTGSVTGRLIFPPGIEEVHRARLTFEPSPPGLPSLGQSMYQDLEIEDGRFTISGVSVSDGVIKISAPSFLPVTRSIEIRDGRSFDCGDIVVQAAARIHGHVTDLFGTPLEGVSIGAVANGESRPGPRPWKENANHQVTVTDANGYYECSVLQTDTKWITAEKDGYALASIDATERGGRDYDFQLHRSGGEIEVLFPTEARKWRLRLRYAGDAPASYDHVPTGPFGSSDFESGRYTFEQLPASSYTVDLWSRSLGNRPPEEPVPGESFRRTMTVEEGQPTVVDFRQ